MNITQNVNEYGTPITILRCENCGREFSICPAIEENDMCQCDCKNKKNYNEKLIEKLSKYIHDEQWSGWMKYLFSKCEIQENKSEEHVKRYRLTGNLIIPKWAVDRWARQMNTKYEDLTEIEKKSDKEEAKVILNIIFKME